MADPLLSALFGIQEEVKSVNPYSLLPEEPAQVAVTTRNNDLSDVLASALTRPQESPYYLGSRAAFSVPSVISPYRSTGTQLATALASGIGGSILKNLADRDAARQNLYLQQDLRDFYNSDDAEEQENILLRSPKLAGIINEITSEKFKQSLENQKFLLEEDYKQQQAQDLQEIKDAAALERAKEITRRVQSTALINQDYSPEEANRMVGARPAETLSKGSPEIEQAINDLIPGSKAQEQNMSTDPSILSSEITRKISPKKQKEGVEFVNSKIKDFLAGQQAKVLNDINPYFDSLRLAYKDDSIASDYQFLSSFIRINDPGVSVRSEEYRTLINNIQSLPQDIRGNILKTFNGKSKLSKIAKDAVYKLGIDKINTFTKGYNKARQDSLPIIQAYEGADPNLFLESVPEKELFFDKLLRLRELEAKRMRQ